MHNIKILLISNDSQFVSLLKRSQSVHLWGKIFKSIICISTFCANKCLFPRMHGCWATQQQMASTHELQVAGWVCHGTSSSTVTLSPVKGNHWYLLMGWQPHDPTIGPEPQRPCETAFLPFHHLLTAFPLDYLTGEKRTK